MWTEFSSLLFNGLQGGNTLTLNHGLNQQEDKCAWCEGYLLTAEFTAAPTNLHQRWWLRWYWRRRPARRLQDTCQFFCETDVKHLSEMKTLKINCSVSAFTASETGGGSEEEQESSLAFETTNAVSMNSSWWKSSHCSDTSESLNVSNLSELRTGYHCLFFFRNHITCFYT